METDPAPVKGEEAAGAIPIRGWGMHFLSFLISK